MAPPLTFGLGNISSGVASPGWRAWSGAYGELTSMNAMQVVINTRVSNDQNSGRSVQDQERGCRAECERIDAFRKDMSSRPSNPTI
jgi:hypothetical protein